MGRLEVACRRFAVLSGIRQEPDNYATCVYPKAVHAQRRGLLALVTEPAGYHSALATDASRLVHDVLVRQYFSDQSLSLTGGLLKALESANGALLEYNYSTDLRPASGEWQSLPAPQSSVAVQAGGVRTRRTQVGLTAVLLHPDGAGVYLAQMSPTQAYVVHNGVLSALPEPQSWQPVPGKVAVTLRRVPNPDEEDYDENPQEDSAELSPVTLPALPLGSGTDVDVDLLYRRVEPGDLIAVVSTSLARHLDRTLAEEIFSSLDADTIVHSLYTLATERGLAQSHACVLQLGVPASSGVDEDFTAQVAAPTGESVAANGGAQYEPQGSEHPQSSSLLDMIKGSRQWFWRRKPSSEVALQTSTDDPARGEGQVPELPTEEGAFPQEPMHPTQVLLHRILEVPPYKSNNATTPQLEEELQFDGWEDVPPALGNAQDAAILSGTYQPVHVQDSWERAALDGESVAASGGDAASDVWVHTTPPHFRDQATTDDVDAQFIVPPTAGQSRRDALAAKAGQVGGQAAGWANRVLHGMLPERNGEAAVDQTQPRPLVPARLLIAAGVVALVGVLMFSILSLARNPKQAAVNTFLTQAQQEDLLANQLSTPPAEREQHLLRALEEARQALQADPQSTQAAALVQKSQASLDTLQGITRIEPKLLFDLAAADKPGSTSSQQGEAQTGATTGSGQLAGIVVQGNDAYVLDKEKGAIYSCRLSARDCAAILKAGDTAGDQKAGSPMAITLRVGSLVAVDSNLAAYIFSADTGSWQPQSLGEAATLEKPKDVGSYDGNLYLLASKAGQISKYVAGRYGETPDDWIKDQASIEQMKNPLAMGIDGSIYVLLADGKILVMQGGKITRTLTPKLSGDPAGMTQLFTGTDTQDLYLFSPSAGSITRVTKEGQTRATYKLSAGSDAKSLSGMTVSEGRGKLYLLQGRQVYEASMTAARAKVTPVVPGDAVNESQPVARPTVAP